ncbi:hypothetical protein ABVT39_018905 [Epinephelus coioides]
MDNGKCKKDYPKHFRYDAHINVEIVCSVTSVKYLYKYIDKGPDRCMVYVGGPEEDIQHDEIQRYEGTTFHSHTKYPIILTEESTCAISKNDSTEQLIHMCSLLVIDEVSMMDRRAVEAADRTFRWIRQHDSPFGELVSGIHTGTPICIPRISISPSDNIFPFTLSRKQFPVRPCFAMTVNKSQGQSMSRVGVYSVKEFFSHGQFYVAASRVGATQLRILPINEEDSTKRREMNNDVYKEILTHT